MIYQYTVSKLTPRQTVPQIFRKAKYPEMKHQYFSEKIGRLPIFLFFYNQPSQIFNARFPRTNVVRLNSLSLRRAVFRCCQI